MSTESPKPKTKSRSGGLSGEQLLDATDKLCKVAEIMAKSNIIPKHYQGNPGNIFVALQTAYKMNLDPMIVMQSTYIISGKIGMTSSFAIALANHSDMFSNGIRYREEGSGDNLSVTAYATIKDTNELIESTVSMKMAKAERWDSNPKYKSMPQHMLRYRAAVFLIRTHAPEVLNGMHMIDELEDVSYAEKSSSEVQSPSSAKDKIMSKLDEVIEKSVEASQEVECSPEELEKIKADLIDLIAIKSIPQEEIDNLLKRANVENIGDFNAKQATGSLKFLRKKYGNS